MKFFSKVFLLVALLSFKLSIANPIAIQSVDVPTATSPQSEIIFNFSGPVPAFHAFRLDNPERLVLDFTGNLQFTAHPTRQLFSDSIVDDIRVGQPGSRLRVVMDLLYPARYHIVQLTPTTLSIVLTRSGQNPAPRTPSTPANPTVPVSKPGTPGIEISSQTQTPITEPNQNQHRPIIVVIDPGHGGKDPGATGPQGIHEKTVVLAICNKLLAQLNHDPNFHAELTRHGDYFISLRDRLQIARRDKADLFVAVHADAYPDQTSHGASVFALSDKGATSEAAHWLEEKENYSELGYVNLANKNAMLRSVLIDLSQTATINDSLHIGKAVLDDLGQVGSLHSTSVEQAGFVVLKSPDIPSILVETGFITTPSEEVKLQDPHYQADLAHAIATGIKHYFSQNPPPGTSLAAHPHTP